MKRYLIATLAIAVTAASCAAAQRSPAANEACAIANAASPYLNGLVDELIRIVTGGGTISDQSEQYVSGLEQAYHVGEPLLCPPASPGAMGAPMPPSLRLRAFLAAHPGHTVHVAPSGAAQ